MVLLVALWTAAAPPAQLPDTARTARVERVINAANDSISRLGGAASVFPLDLQAVSQALVLERAARIQDGCAGAAAGLESLLRVLGAETVTPRAVAEQARLRAAARDLRRTLVQCGREWNPRPPTAARADSLRDWGPYRIQQLDVALRRYDAARRAFQEKAGLQKPPPQ